MGYRYFNSNPLQNITEDCTVRTLSKVLNISWDEAFDMLSDMAKKMCVMPSDKNAFSAVLRMNGFYRQNLPNICPECFTIRDFARENPVGKYVLCTGNHVVAVVNGDYFDIWNSGDEIVLWFWTR